MILWAMQNISTIIISAALIVIVGVIITFLAINKKKGKPSCGYGCANCAASGICRLK